MYKTIIVPIDMSHTEKADAMLKTAKHLVDNDGVIVLVNIVEEVPAHISAEFPGGLIAKAKDNAHAALEGIGEAAGAKTVVEVRSGSAHNSILTVAQEKNADAIIIGSHKPGLTDYFLGSTAARVVRHANCSVFVLR